MHYGKCKYVKVNMSAVLWQLKPRAIPCFWKKNIYDKDELEGSIGLRRKIFDGNCYQSYFICYVQREKIVTAAPFTPKNVASIRAGHVPTILAVLLMVLSNR